MLRRAQPRSGTNACLEVKVWEGWTREDCLGREETSKDMGRIYEIQHTYVEPHLMEGRYTSVVSNYTSTVRGRIKHSNNGVYLRYRRTKKLPNTVQSQKS